MYTHDSPADKAKRASGIFIVLFFVGFLALVFLYLHYVEGPRFAAYVQTPIRGRVERITSREKGIPTVLFHRQSKPQSLSGPQDFGEYLAVRDSVVKPAGSQDLYIYRRGARATEVSIWRYEKTKGGRSTTLSRTYLAN